MIGVILKLGAPCTIERLEVDTAHFKGNFPDSCSLETCCATNLSVDARNAEAQTWMEVLPKAKLLANFLHRFNRLVKCWHRHSRAISNLSRWRRKQTPASLGAQKSQRAKKNLSNLIIWRGIRRPKPCWIAVVPENGRNKWPSSGLLPIQQDYSSRQIEFGQKCSPGDWLEAFHHHPPIGAKRAAAKQSSTQSRWSAKEQSAVKKAAPEVLTALAKENKAYTNKFGYVFLICATGKTSEEILKDLKQRMPNDAETELRLGAEEQRKIMRLRLEKLLNS